MPKAEYVPAQQASIMEASYHIKHLIPYFVHTELSKCSRLKITLENMLLPHATKLFKYQLLVHHLVADAYLNSPTTIHIQWLHWT